VNRRVFRAPRNECRVDAAVNRRVFRAPQNESRVDAAVTVFNC